MALLAKDPLCMIEKVTGDMCEETARQLLGGLSQLFQSLQMESDALLGLESLDFVCVDDLEKLLGNKLWEEALFDLYNRIFDSGSQLVVAANDSYQSLPFVLEDLRSRLSWGFTFHLKALQDEGKLQLMTQLAEEHGWQLGHSVGQYILRHYSRDTHSVVELVRSLDKLSLSRSRKVTLPLVKEWIAEL